MSILSQETENWQLLKNVVSSNIQLSITLCASHTILILVYLFGLTFKNVGFMYC